MNGPEHYRVAEVLLKNLRNEVGDSGMWLYTPDHQKRIIAEAQAHATLALVAVTHDVAAGADRATAWREAVS